MGPKGLKRGTKEERSTDAAVKRAKKAEDAKMKAAEQAEKSTIGVA